MKERSYDCCCQARLFFLVARLLGVLWFGRGVPHQSAIAAFTNDQNQRRIRPFVSEKRPRCESALKQKAAAQVKQNSTQQTTDFFFLKKLAAAAK